MNTNYNLIKTSYSKAEKIKSVIFCLQFKLNRTCKKEELYIYFKDSGFLLEDILYYH